jgi:hypothetical protein
MEIKHIAVIFDTTLRPETAGVYCHRALERFVQVKHFQPHELEHMPHEGFDLYLNIDDGLRYHLPPEGRQTPTVHLALPGTWPRRCGRRCWDAR